MKIMTATTMITSMILTTTMMMTMTMTITMTIPRWNCRMRGGRGERELVPLPAQLQQTHSKYKTTAKWFFFSRLKVLADFSLEPLGFSPVVHLPPSPSCPAKGAGPVYLFGWNHFQMSTSIRVKTIEEKIHWALLIFNHFFGQIYLSRGA